MTMITIFAALLLLIGTANATESDSWPSFPNEGRFLNLNENDDFDPVLDFGDLDGSYGSYDDDATTETATTTTTTPEPEPQPDLVLAGTFTVENLNPATRQCGNPAKDAMDNVLGVQIAAVLGGIDPLYVTILDDCAADSLLRRGRSLTEFSIDYEVEIAAIEIEAAGLTIAVILADVETFTTSVAVQSAFLDEVVVGYGQAIQAAENDGIDDNDLPALVADNTVPLEVASFSFVDETEYAAAPVPESSTDDGLSGGAIAGIVIACVVAVAAIVGAVVFVNTQETAASSGAGDGGGDDVFATTDKKSCQNDL